MTTISELSLSDVDSYDYIIVGGGTAGCVIASRLAEYLPHKKTILIEAGPSDFMDNRVLDLRKWLDLLGGELDYDYTTTEQPMGNSHIRHSRAKVLGGCSSHNTLISFRPFKFDMDIWQSMGAKGWTFETMMRVLDRLRNTVQPVHARHRNQLCRDWVQSCSKAMNIPVISDFNREIKERGALPSSVGFFSVAYDPDTHHRSSASVAYIHPILRGDEPRPNLTILTNAWVNRVDLSSDNNHALGVTLTLQSGQRFSLRARRETILCAGAIDTPRLLLHSGIGPKSQLESLGIANKVDLPGVGENLLDHPETIIMWELNTPVPPNQTTMDSDAGIFLRREPVSAAANPSTHRKHDNQVENPFNPCLLDDGSIPDVMMHCYQIPFTLNTARHGYHQPVDAFCMTPNIPRPRSKGRLYLTSADPHVKPALDFRYFTDPGNYDADTFVFGLRAARKIAQQAPFKNWLKREVAPGPACQTDAQLSEYARKVAHTVYHPAGTTKMGDTTNDEFAVVDCELNVKGVRGLRVADAGVFPSMVTINPMLTVLGVGERAAEMIAEEAGWQRRDVPAKARM